MLGSMFYILRWFLWCGDKISSDLLESLSLTWELKASKSEGPIKQLYRTAVNVRVHSSIKEMPLVGVFAVSWIHPLQP